MKAPRARQVRPGATIERIGDLTADPANRRAHNARNLSMVVEALHHVGAARSIVIDEHNVILAGNGVTEAAAQAGITKLRVIDASGDELIAVRRSGLTDEQKRALAIFDNRTAELAEWNVGQLAADVKAGLTLEPFFFEDELRTMFADDGVKAGRTDPDVAPPTRATGIQSGDVFELGAHRLLCGDSASAAAAALVTAGRRAGLCVTSPPYASQRAYDPLSDFRPVPPDEYVAWFATIQSAIGGVLSDDGSYCLNIKEHCDGGQRHLYVKDLTIAHVRQWGWRFVDEFCWRDTKNGVPGGWPNRFKDAWEPVFHYCRQASIKFHALANGSSSDAVFDYSASSAKTKTGSGLLGVKATAERAGIARPSNVIECAAASTGGHSAAFPVALPIWFMKAFTDADDLVFEPFGGSGTTMIAAEQLGRACAAIEISPAYCQVIIDRWEAFTGNKAVKAGEALHQ
jgi:site-specific DNA-methyltransferase (adenine-specific)/site-specific DNA-methyltransferase (cytosine-N4-specific)